jgi:antibiotic biosynthesis monooxygenase (ABM) superfamily enzyme
MNWDEMAGEDNTQKTRPRWQLAVLIAISLLIVILNFAFLFSGKEIIERPILVLFVFLAWFGALVGITVASSTD